MNSDSQINVLWAQCLEVWGASQIVNRSPAWRGEPLECHLVELATAIADQLQSNLLEALHDERPRVVAYCLLVLLHSSRMSLLTRAQHPVFARSERVTVQVGSYRNSMKLGEFAYSLFNEVQLRPT